MCIDFIEEICYKIKQRLMDIECQTKGSLPGGPDRAGMERLPISSGTRDQYVA
jgi:hypothetical protein